MKTIDGGICAAKGFTAAGMHAGIKPGTSPDRNDLALIYSEVPCQAAGMFTTNRVKADPVKLDMDHLKDGKAQAIIANSFIANACAPEGPETAKREAEALGKALSLDPDDILVSSTGVIGQRLNVEAIETAIPELISRLSKDGSDAAAHSIMTTDTVKKERAVEFTVGGKTAHLGGITKGSGMIHPHMGTMLCYLTTDVKISSAVLKKALQETVRRTFNRISVDGDMSTNDTCIILANGLTGNAEIEEGSEDYNSFLEAMLSVTTYLARLMASDGEGASHLMTCVVKGARNEETAETIAKSVINSSLTKAAIFGEDANWGRVLCAAGYSGADFDPDKTDISFSSKAGTIPVCEAGKGLDFDEDLAKKVLSEEEVIIEIDLHEGDAEVTCWGCDLTYDYVKINGDYRT